MADTTVFATADGSTDLKNGLWGPYQLSLSVKLAILMELGGDLRLAWTSDFAENWVTTQIDGGGGVVAPAVWFDQETPGDTGELAHVAWMQGGEVLYQTVSVRNRVLGTLRVVDATVTLAAAGLNRLAISKATNGDLLISGSTQTEIFTYLSDDGGATWSAVADMFETATEEDFLKLYPADVDAGDFAGLFWDSSASEFSLKMFDKSADTVTETAIAGSMTADALHYNFDGAIRISDAHLLANAHSNDDDAGDDVLSWDITVDSIAAPTITAKTNVETNIPESAQVAVQINQQNDDWSVQILKGGTWESAVDVVSYLSTDGGTSWDAGAVQNDAAADDIRLLQTGRTIGAAGGHRMPIWFNDDLTDDFVNIPNAAQIADADTDKPLYEGAATSSSASTASATVTIPSHANGDRLDIHIATTLTASPATAINTPAGWTKGEDVEAGTISAVRLTHFYKDGDGIEASVAITLVGDPTFGFGAVCTVHSNATTGAIDVSGSAVQDAGVDITAPSVVTTVNDVGILYAYVFDDDVSTDDDCDSDAGFNGFKRGYAEVTGIGNGLAMAVATSFQDVAGASASCVWSSNGDDDAGCATTTAFAKAPAGGISVPVALYHQRHHNKAA